MSTAEPLPGRAVIRQRWSDAAFLHWRIDPALAGPLLPPGTRPDLTPDGATWVGLIAFRMECSAFPPLPPVPVLGTFLETNVRLYSRDEQDRPAVVFRSLEAQRLVPVLTARIGLGLPYRWARMRSRRRGDEIAYASEQLEGAVRPRSLMRVRVSGEQVLRDPLADFLTARWAMHVGRLGRTTYWRNEHQPWPLFRAEALEVRDELVAAGGLPGVTAEPPDSVLFSPGVTTRFSGPS